MLLNVDLAFLWFALICILKGRVIIYSPMCIFKAVLKQNVKNFHTVFYIKQNHQRLSG